MASFKKYEREQVLTLNALVTADVSVGDLVKTTGSGATLTIVAATDLTDAQYIVAQGDMVTLKQPTEYKSYKISPVVAASTALKNVAVYLITDETQVEL